MSKSTSELAVDIILGIVTPFIPRPFEILLNVGKTLVEIGSCIESESPRSTYFTPSITISNRYTRICIACGNSFSTRRRDANCCRSCWYKGYHRYSVD